MGILASHRAYWGLAKRTQTHEMAQTNAAPALKSDRRSGSPSEGGLQSTQRKACQTQRGGRGRDQKGKEGGRRRTLCSCILSSFSPHVNALPRFSSSFVLCLTRSWEDVSLCAVLCCAVLSSAVGREKECPLAVFCLVECTQIWQHAMTKHAEKENGNHVRPGRADRVGDLQVLRGGSASLLKC